MNVNQDLTKTPENLHNIIKILVQNGNLCGNLDEKFQINVSLKKKN